MTAPAPGTPLPHTLLPRGHRPHARTPHARTWWCRVWAVISWTVGLLLTLFAVAAWPQQYGGVTTVTIVSGQSMEPTYSSGDLLLTRQGDYRVGDVVVYEVPADQPGAGHRVVHRIIGGDGDAGWDTQGDNNPAPDIWTPRDSDVVGGVVLHLPKLGLLVMQLRNPMTWAVLGALAVGRVLWPSADDRDDAGPATGTQAVVGGPPTRTPSLVLPELDPTQPDPSERVPATNH